jgi:sugar phosphate isomerase/epimerase
MMKSAITVSLVEQARGGPFVFWDGLEAAAAEAARLGFDAIEIFPPTAETLNPAEINALVKRHGIAVAAVGTGGGWVIHKLHLCLPDATARQRAKDFIRGIVEVAAKLGAPAIIGSMQGRWGEGVTREQALDWLVEALYELGEHAASLGQPLLYEPLNRYETNLFNRIADTVAFLKTLKTTNVKILADLFHMNIEEANVAEALRAGAGFIGHVHFVDSNRRAVGMGHTDFAPMVAALREIGYTGYLSAEAFAVPDSQAVAEQTINSFRKLTDDC